MQIDSATASSSFPLVEWDGTRYVCREVPIYGKVSFSAYKPNAERTRLEKFASFSCRQDEFVELLKTGTFADENGEIFTLTN